MIYLQNVVISTSWWISPNNMVRHYWCLISNDIDLVHLVNTRVNTHQIYQIYHIYVDLRESMYFLVKSTGTLVTRGKKLWGLVNSPRFFGENNVSDQPMVRVVSVGTFCEKIAPEREKFGPRFWEDRMSWVSLLPSRKIRLKAWGTVET